MKLIWSPALTLDGQIATADGNSDWPVHLYKATPQKIWMNSEGEKDGQYIDMRMEAQA